MGSSTKLLSRLNIQVDYRSIDVKTCESAADNGQLGAFQWLRRQNGCEWNSVMECSVAPRRERIDVPAVLVRSYLCSTARENDISRLV